MKKQRSLTTGDSPETRLVKTSGPAHPHSTREPEGKNTAVAKSNSCTPLIDRSFSQVAHLVDAVLHPLLPQSLGDVVRVYPDRVHPERHEAVVQLDASGRALHLQDSTARISGPVMVAKGRKEQKHTRREKQYNREGPGGVRWKGLVSSCGPWTCHLGLDPNNRTMPPPTPTPPPHPLLSAFHFTLPLSPPTGSTAVAVCSRGVFRRKKRRQETPRAPTSPPPRGPFAPPGRRLSSLSAFAP